MFLLYVCLNKDEKSIQVVILFSFFVFSTFMHGFALLPFLLLVFRFSSWFVPLFGYPIYGRRVGGQASVAKVRGGTLGRSQICDRTSFRILRLK